MELARIVVEEEVEATGRWFVGGGVKSVECKVFTPSIFCSFYCIGWLSVCGWEAIMYKSSRYVV